MIIFLSFWVMIYDSNTPQQIKNDDAEIVIKPNNTYKNETLI